MEVFLILCSLLVSHASVIPDETNCKGIVIGDQYFEEEILKSDIDRPWSLAVDYSPNILYFSYNINSTTGDEFQSAKLNINTKEFSNIDGVGYGFAQTVDQKTHAVYIGGNDGIYKYDYSTNTATWYAERGSDIWHIYFNENLYFSVFPAQFLYVLIDGNATRYKYLEDTKVDLFVIDNEGDSFFTNKTGLYSLKKDSKNATLYGEDLIIRSLATDKNGDVYACLRDGLYAVRKQSQSLEKIVPLEDGFGLTFDNENNIVYADDNKIVRLKVSPKKNCDKRTTN